MRGDTKAINDTTHHEACDWIRQRTREASHLLAGGRVPKADLAELPRGEHPRAVGLEATTTRQQGQSLNRTQGEHPRAVGLEATATKKIRGAVELDTTYIIAH